MAVGIERFERLNVQDHCCTPPTFQLATIDTLQAPATRRGFLDTSGKCPTDEYTGLPLPIAPVVDVDALPPELVNEHHHFFPRLSPVLRNTLGGHALRVSRIQRVSIFQHNYGALQFHGFFSEGPDIPTDPNEQLGLCVLACAGYLPNSVVDTSGGEPLIRTMQPWERARLQRPSSYVEPLPLQVKKFRDRRYPELSLREAKQEMIASRKKQADMSYKNLIYGFDPMKKFMVEQIFEQDFEEVKPRVMRGFVEKDSVAKGLAILGIGAVLAAKTATVQGRPLEEVYTECRRAGQLHLQMPPSPATLIKNKLGAIEHRVELLTDLRSHLDARREQRVA
ncbi:MAG TPA: hypothetical protein VN031_01315 [Candidatus Microsaccharimonas sp.]|nr:hypothetical protein [Candidatus Microsaccharimonas sp.]